MTSSRKVGNRFGYSKKETKENLGCGNNLEKLLNKLIEKGWKPFGESRIDEINRAEQYVGNWNWCCWGSKDAIQKRKSTRQLVSKESGLWQFCCDNNLIQTEHGCFIDNGERSKNVFYKVDTYDEEGDIIQTGDMEGDKFIGIYEYEYRLIESALKDESELEQFLLDNIKV